MRTVLVLAVLVPCLLAFPHTGSCQFVDLRASYLGPFNGGSSSAEMAQTMEVSITGYVRRVDAYVIYDAPFDWYLRDGTGFDPVAINVEELAVLAAGTAWGDTSGGGYDSPPVVLLPDASIPVVYHQLLVLHIVTGNNVVWIGAPGNLPGESYRKAWSSSEWEPMPVAGTEFGRVIYVDYSPSPVSASTWGAIKILYR